MPARVMVLSLLLPPRAYEPPAPFGFGAFIVTRDLMGGAKFTTNSHGYGAGYEPLRMRDRIGKLLTPDTKTLIYAAAPQDADQRGENLETAFVRDLDFVPRLGLITVTRMIIPHSEFVIAAGMGNMGQLPANMVTPIQRLRYVGLEAQAAWLWWLFATSSPMKRRSLLAAYRAWSALRRAQVHSSSLFSDQRAEALWPPGYSSYNL
ncbi:hypothetical protein D2V07_12950 [Aurantiacibacter zhengii]|uniref:Uncharacterized protein n=2 Tax=Aurantiacibacter zhengii TaxID=2307003 RepID=A0A418NR18_9SPHN|nr:hypothetical protein D2V07_12950 [Aurantiacibacter zhengii]